ncbi:MAG: hypothetical protein DME22_17925 [Verrucomicrobia bacterium]|nr:MAG: hypothetical protein DME22_17925 [Verrucomicrobiota bacterium]PYJ98540.1 MAG: hypothetical protein DME23_11765 [Verrucomicrobiota bacterium]
MTKVKACELAGTIWTFVLRHSFDIRHSDFDIFQSQRSNAESGIKQLTTDHEPLTTEEIYDQTAKP